MAPATITIADANPNPNNNLFNINFNNTHNILTTVTSDPSVVTSWISAHSPTTNTTQPLTFGFDIEWRPNFGRQYDNPVATIQLCTTTNNPHSNHSHSCLIFQILYCPSPLPKSLSDFLSNNQITFVGVGIRSDVEQLLVDHDLNVKNMVDLGELAVQKIAGARKGMGLKELSKVVMGVEVLKPKNVTLSRWDCEWLSYAQVQYACIDAFLSFQIAYNLMPLPCVN